MHRTPGYSSVVHATTSFPSRRTFLRSVAIGGAALAAGDFSRMSAQDSAASAPAGAPGARKLGVALAGLGRYSTGEIAPALKQTRLCTLKGVITGDREKGQRWSAEHGFPEKNVYAYADLPRIAENPDIDIIYIVTPPGLHAQHVIDAAKSGKHIICEKPMANNAADCQRMIDACRAAGVKLSIGYRLQFSPHHQEIDRLAREQDFGAFTDISGEHSMNLTRREWRVDQELAGGGPLMDVGIYVIQTACRAARALPEAVTAREEPKTNPELFNEVEEALHWRMEFPGGARGEGFTSYAKRGSQFRAEGARGWIELQPAYGYRGIDGKTSRGPLNVAKNVPQQALQMDDFADCILTGRATPVPGEMGRDHMAVIDAIYEAARTGRRVEVKRWS